MKILSSIFIIVAALHYGSAAQITNKGLDLSFGNSGIALTSIYTDRKFKTPTDLIIQPDGKILISGHRIGRYKSNGTPDSGFATNGFFLPPYQTPYEANARAIALQSDGKLLSIGKPDSGCSYIVRLLPNGTIDSSFGKYGLSKNDRLDANKIVLQSDGKIIIIGNGCGNVGVPEDSIFVGRFKSDGSRDSSFGDNGFTKAYLGRYGGYITNMGLLPDGRIAMGGIGHDSGYRKMIALRFLPDGSPDSSLGGKGRTFPLYAWYCRPLVVLPDGKMLFALADLNYQDLTRINADGSPDTTFGEKGFIAIDGFDIGGLLQLQDGRILCSGGIGGDAGVACLRQDGKGLDSSFGQQGMIKTDLTGYSEDYLKIIALQADNKIVGFGYGALDAATPAGVMLVRYHPNAATGTQPYASPLGAALTVYPNPARTHISFSGVASDKIAAIQITAWDGRLLSVITAPQSTTIPIAGYLPGTYLLRVVLKTGGALHQRFTLAY